MPFNPFVVAFSPEAMHGLTKIMPWECSHRDAEGKIPLAWVYAKEPANKEPKKDRQPAHAWCSICGASWASIRAGWPDVFDESSTLKKRKQ